MTPVTAGESDKDDDMLAAIRFALDEDEAVPAHAKAAPSPARPGAARPGKPRLRV